MLSISYERENYDALKNLAASYVDPITNKG